MSFAAQCILISMIGHPGGGHPRGLGREYGFQASFHNWHSFTRFWKYSTVHA